MLTVQLFFSYLKISIANNFLFPVIFIGPFVMFLSFTFYGKDLGINQGHLFVRDFTVAILQPATS